MELLDTRIDGGVGVAGSTTRAHWITPAKTQVRHGSGITGDIEIAGQVTTWSLVRGAWEVRLARVESLETGIAAAHLQLRVGGWAIAAEQVDVAVGGPDASATANGLTSRVHPQGDAVVRVETRTNASPLGDSAAVPVAQSAVRIGEWVITAVGLGATPTLGDAPTAELLTAGYSPEVAITWGDGIRTVTSLTDPRIAAGAARSPEDPTSGPRAIAKEQQNI